MSVPAPAPAADEKARSDVASAPTAASAEVADFDVGQLVSIDLPEQSFLRNKQGIVLQKQSTSSSSVVAVRIRVNAEKLQQCMYKTILKDKTVDCSVVKSLIFGALE